MDAFLRARAEQLDIASCGTDLRLRPPLEHRVPTGCTWYLFVDGEREQERVMELLGSPELAPELIPLFCLGKPLVTHRERRDDWRAAPILYRFPGESGQGQGCPPGKVTVNGERNLLTRLERELQSCRAVGRVTVKLAQLILAVPKAAADVARCREILWQHRIWLNDWLYSVVPAMFGPTPFLHSQEVAGAIAALIPPSELAVKICQHELGKLQPDALVAAFSAIIRPDWNFGLPAVYCPYRKLLYDALCRTFADGNSLARCDAVEL